VAWLAASTLASGAILTVVHQIGELGPTTLSVLTAKTASSSPNALPFTVENESLLFAARVENVKCNVARKSEFGDVVFDSDAATLSGNGTLPPRGSLTFHCEIPPSHASTHLAIVDISLDRTARFFGIEWRYIQITRPFNWLHDPCEKGKWMKEASLD
jgi:hypothetical protein